MFARLIGKADLIHTYFPTAQVYVHLCLCPGMQLRCPISSSTQIHHSMPGTVLNEMFVAIILE